MSSRDDAHATHISFFEILKYRNICIHFQFQISIRNFGITHPSYSCITVLRILYQKQFLPEIWKKIKQLQSHHEERKGTQKYEQERLQIAQFILKFFKLDGVFSEEEIMRVCGIVTVNLIDYIVIHF